MTAQEALNVFGSSIPFQYYNGSDYTSGTFIYNRTLTQSAYNVNSANNSYTFEGNVWLEYSFNQFNNYSTNPQYISIDISPLYSIFDTTQIHSCIALSSSSAVSDSVYQSPSWDWVYNGSSVHIENLDTTSNSDYKAEFYVDGVRFNFVCCDLTSQNTASGYSSRAVFSGNTVSGSWMRLLIAVPYISTGASGQTGTFTTVSGGSSGDTNITVNVDMSETNEELQHQTGILSTISNWLSSFFTTLGNTVLSWFMPSQNFLSNWVTRIKNILLDHLSPWGDMDDTISNVLERIVAALGEGGVESVEFPALSVPGTDFSTQSISVPLWPSGTSSLQYWVKLAVNLVSTIWVCNMVLNKIKSKILGESVVEVEELENNDN